MENSRCWNSDGEEDNDNGTTKIINLFIYLITPTVYYYYYYHH